MALAAPVSVSWFLVELGSLFCGKLLLRTWTSFEKAVLVIVSAMS